MRERIPCSVPFCGRTVRAKGRDTEIICGKHWRMASADLRRAHSKLYRAYRRKFGDNGWWNYPGGSPERIECLGLARQCYGAWDAVKRDAIERAGGL